MSLIGEMRNRIALQTLSSSTDAGGGKTTSYSTQTTVWAKVVNNSGSESVFGDQLRATNNFTFTIRYLSTLTTAYRISYDSKTFNITGIVDLDEGKRKFQVITATEGVAT
ncbi:phage head closure protein [Hyphomonas sp.]|jgi:SPP1 family predicted phage head-tail adaptor|uniref:phage head closure protein n=1 Tax=Hyphomonas sp. TaxID=87 RepID=UPI000C91BC47|nr:phage head closure protein [Hyphomonas sp.]MAL42896.1 hypothetical protein [Hyphomonas sp.]